MILDVRDFLGVHADTKEIVDCTKKLLMELLENGWIEVYDVSGSQFRRLDLEPSLILKYILGAWEKIGWQEPSDVEVMWYKLSDKGIRHWESL